MDPNVLYVYDPESAEILKPIDFLKDIEQLSDQDLLDLIVAVDALVNDLSPVAGRIRSIMYQRMTADQATVRETPEYRAELVTQRSYEYDMAKLLTLKSHLTGEQFEAAFKTTVSPNKTQLNKLVKLGGAIKQIIESATVPVEKPPKLEITRKQEVPQVG